jgi:hypothetical protein
MLYEVTYRATFIFVHIKRINSDIGKASFKYQRQ